MRRNPLPEADPGGRAGGAAARRREEADLLHREGLLRADQREAEERPGGDGGHQPHGAGNRTGPLTPTEPPGPLTSSCSGL